ncbi:Mu transposase C-terminal domain-containing protein [Chelatococcus sp. YT9]|uniref:Mu transposase C-terminal domain-containing protein n=1 Tax=Chelatococcus sp. YT9 TaxID=2835635 RepID=UPI001BCD0D1B|nr:Mu transposase C-terminal domain-containing protein [Chelatococcus sp. YT9]MBS7697482.1 DDE-type integrase/transposase/recombinase [Chelatococcus sp. YT9]MBS7698956.1 DDE-type integrase/transposase/recombinase [Chelatococcus sp. YT9]MBS7701427.1 DDE-type integrase/transposase/recombinase [Chelatococcus sp. YT9]
MSAPDLSMVDASAWDEARRCLPVIRRLAENPARTRGDVVAAAVELGCGPTHAYALLRRYLADARLTSLLPRRRGPERGISLLDEHVDAVIRDVIDTVYLTRQRPRIADLAEEVRRRCKAEGLRVPSRKAITARVKARPAREVAAKREGRKAVRERYLPVVGSLEAHWPLSLIQIDHTLVDVIVVDSETRAPIQRPWLTLAIDVCSRCVAGFHLSLEPPSATSVALCLTHAALSKESWLAERGIDAEWPVRGIPERLHLDNAKEFRSEALKRGCEQYGIAIDYRPVRTPHYGGHIERLIGTMMGKVHLLPGTTFSDVRAKGDLNPEKTAAMTLDEVERWLGYAIAGVYHRDLHRGLGITPLAAWQRGIAGDGTTLGRGEPTAVTDARRFLIDFLPIARRRVRRDGVALHSIAYWADVLGTWIGHPEQMIVRYDPRDLSRIYLLGPDGTYYNLSYRDLRRPPISLWEHRLALKRLRDEGRSLVDEEAIFRTIEAMRTIADGAVRASKAARRQRERRLRVAPEARGDLLPVEPDETDRFRQIGADTPPHERMFPVEEWE